MNDFRLDDEVALITGGGTGLGRAIAGCMAKAGARVAIVGRRESVLRETAEQLGDNVTLFLHDVTRVERVPDLVARVADTLGPVSVLMNNAGGHLKKPAVDTTEQEFLEVINTHVMGAFALSRAVAPAMVERGHGSILFTASMTSLFGMPQVVAYSAAKSAYLGMVRSLAVELSPHGVRVNAIAPGFIATDMVRTATSADPKRKRKILERTPMNRLGDPQDIGRAAVYLASPAASFITGAVLPVDGGASIGF